MSRAVMQQALEALVTCCAEEWRTLNNFGMKQVYDEKKVNAAVAALHAALAEPENQSKSQADTKVNPAEPEQEPVPWEQFYPDIGKPQTTHWEGCEAVHPECKEKNT